MESGYYSFQETKIESMGVEVIRDLWSGNYVDWVTLDARGTVGGIMILWDRKVVHVVDDAKRTFSVSCFFRNVGDGFEWVLSGVYGPKMRMLLEALFGLNWMLLNSNG